MTPSRRTFLLGADAKRLLDRLGLGRARPVRWLAGRAKARVFSAEGDVRLKMNGFVLQMPVAFLPHYVHREYEPLTARWIRRSVSRGMVVADVGAHVGYFTLLFSRLVGEAGRVFAVEPAQDNLRLLRSNVSANGLRNVVVLPFAAGKERRQRSFHLTGSSDSHGFYDHPLTSTVETLEVTQVPLDELIELPLDLVKIDVEGAELEVLEGMGRLLDESTGVRLVVEWSPACMRSAGHEPGELPRYLAARGFRLSVIDERAGRHREVEEILEELRRGGVGPAWYGNLVGTRQGRP